MGRLSLHRGVGTSRPRRSRETPWPLSREHPGPTSLPQTKVIVPVRAPQASIPESGRGCNHGPQHGALKATCPSHVLEAGSPRSRHGRAGSSRAALPGVWTMSSPHVLTRSSLVYLCPDLLFSEVAGGMLMVFLDKWFKPNFPCEERADPRGLGADPSPPPLLAGPQSSWGPAPYRGTQRPAPSISIPGVAPQAPALQGKALPSVPRRDPTSRCALRVSCFPSRWGRNSPSQG